MLPSIVVTSVSLLIVIVMTSVSLLPAVVVTSVSLLTVTVVTSISLLPAVVVTSVFLLSWWSQSPCCRGDLSLPVHCYCGDLNPPAPCCRGDLSLPAHCYCGGLSLPAPCCRGDLNLSPCACPSFAGVERTRFSTLDSRSTLTEGLTKERWGGALSGRDTHSRYSRCVVSRGRGRSCLGHAESEQRP